MEKVSILDLMSTAIEKGRGMPMAYKEAVFDEMDTLLQSPEVQQLLSTAEIPKIRVVAEFIEKVELI